MDLSNLRILVSVATEVAEQKLSQLQNKIESFSEKAAKTLAGMSDGMKKSGESIANFGEGLKKAGSSVESVGKKLSIVTTAVGTVLGLAFKKSTDYIKTYESVMSTFKNSAQIGEQGAKDLYNSILTVAKNSSFAREHIMNASQSLVAMGTDAKKTTKYVQSISNAIAKMGKSGTEIEEMAEMFGTISLQTNIYTNDLNRLAKAGIPALDILATHYKTTKDEVKKMASDGLLPASESLDILTDALETTDEASEMFQYSVVGMAKKLKEGTLTGTLDSLNTSLRTFSLRLLHLDPDVAGGQENIERLNRAISKFGGTLEKVGEKFGFVGDWISSGLENVTSFLDKFNSALDNMPESQAQAIAKVIASLAASGPALILVGNAMKNFGGSFSAIGKAISSFSGFGGMIEKLGKSGNFIKQLVPSFAQIGSGILDIFKPLGNATGSMLSKLGQNIVGFLSPLGEKIGGLLSPISEKIVGTFSSIGGKIGGFLAPLGEKIGGGLNGILGTVGKYAPQLMSGFTSAFNFSAIGGLVLVGLGLIKQNFGDKISEISTFLIEKGPEIITNFVNGIVTALPQLIEQGSQLLQTIINVINANLPAIVQAGISIISTLVIGLAQQLPTLIPMALDTILILIEALLDNIDLLIDAGIALIVGLAEGLINAVPKLIEKAPILIEKLLTAIAKNLPKILEMGIKLLVELAMGLIKAIPQLVSKIPQIITAIIKALGEGLKGMADVGKNLVQGLWNGIKDMIGWIKEKIQGFGESVLNGLKSFFGIASPSKLMRDKVGKFIAQGIGVGFSNEIANVEKSMVGEMENLTDSLGVGEIPYNASVSGKANVGLVNGLTTALQLNSGNQDINLVVDGRTLATVIYNPLNKLTQQKGVNAYA